MFFFAYGELVFFLQHLTAKEQEEPDLVLLAGLEFS